MLALLKKIPLYWLYKIIFKTFCFLRILDRKKVCLQGNKHNYFNDFLKILLTRAYAYEGKGNHLQSVAFCCGEIAKRNIFKALLKQNAFDFTFETGASIACTTKWMYHLMHQKQRPAKLLKGIQNFCTEWSFCSYWLSWLNTFGLPIKIYRGLGIEGLATFFKQYPHYQNGFYFLDSHWLANFPDCNKDREEIDIIFQKDENAVVMLDDYKHPKDERYLSYTVIENVCYHRNDPLYVPADKIGAEKYFLGIDFLQEVIEKHQLKVFLPKYDFKEFDTQSGTVVLAKSTEKINLLKTFNCLAYFEN